MKAVILRRPAQRGEWAEALAAGLRRHGIAVQMAAPGLPVAADFIACWGWRNAERYRRIGRQILLLERGYAGDRFAWTSLGWNGLNGRATVPPPGDAGERWQRLFGDLEQPWRTGGAYILLIGQVPGDAAIAGVDMRRWYAQAAAAARRFGLPVRFRPHPVAASRGLSTPTPPGAEPVPASETLAVSLAGAAWAVTWNSNTGVDAALAGVPVVACDPGSMAWPVAGHDPAEQPGTPDRAEWTRALAWRQWSIDEIRGGAAWDHLRQAM